MFVPVRWLPIKANMDFVHANRETRRLLREIIRERKKEIGKEDVKGKNIREEFTESGSRDFLTYMLLYEKSEGKTLWTDDDLLGHVSSGFAHTSTTSHLIPF